MPTATQQAVQEEEAAAPPPNTLQVLRTFVKVQESRRAHWAEYHDALAAHAKARQSAADEASPKTDLSTPRLGGCACQASSTSVERVAMSDADLTRVLALVTAGLIDAAHSARTCAVTLASASEADDSQLAKLINSIQDAENQLLRSTVELEQLKRSHQESLRDQSSQMASLEQSVAQARESIMEGMLDVRAEIAERSEE